ncbi:hypothetical protein K8I85_08965 [bacterium]|nr:hypothetical protein [bacterium]
MPRTFPRIAAVLAALWIGLIVPIGPHAAAVAGDTAPAAAAHRASTDASAPEGAAVEGGSVLICVLTGMLFGAAVMSGNALAAGGAVVGAINNGCLW